MGGQRCSAEFKLPQSNPRADSELMVPNGIIFSPRISLSTAVISCTKFPAKLSYIVTMDYHD